MAIKPILIGVAVSAVILAYFTKQIENTSQLKSEIPRSIIKEEHLRDLSTQDIEKHVEAEEDRQDADYGSIDAVFNALHEEATQLLEEYKYHESTAEASIESQYALHMIRMDCSALPIIETQEDFNHWVFKQNFPPNNIDIDLHVRSVMHKVAVCREVQNYVGYEKLADLNFVLQMLQSAATKGHPIAKMVVQRHESLSVTERINLLNEAYAYSNTYPKYKVEVYDTALRFLRKSSKPKQDINDLKRALTIMTFRDGAIFKENLPPQTVHLEIKAELEKYLLPIEIDNMLTRISRLSNAVENGDWSFLGLTDNEP